MWYSKYMKYIYVIRKYVVASNIKQAIKLDKETDVHDCWLSEGSTNLLHDNKLK